MYRRSFLRTVGASVAVTGVGSAETTTTETPTPTHTEGFEPLGSVAIPGGKEAVVGADGRTAYVAATDGFVTVDLADPENPRVLAERRGLLADRENGPMGQIQDVKVDGDRLLVVGPAHSTRDSPAAALLYDVSDPANPKRVTVYPTKFAIHNGFLAGTTAYLTDNADRPRLVVVDMEAGAELGSWSVVDADAAWADVSNLIKVIHDVHVRGDRAYVAHWDAGTWLLDVADPADPTAIAQVRGRSPETLASLSTEEVSAEAWELPGNDHYAQPGADGVVAIGAEAWVYDDDGEGGPGGVELWDTSTPSESSRLARIAPPPTPDPSPDGVWTTSHNFDIVDGRLYTSWYQGGVRVHDVSDPRAPEELAAWRWSSKTSFWTAQAAVLGEFFVASSRKDPGNPNNPPRLYTFPDPTPVPTTTAPAGTAEQQTTGGAGGGFGMLAGVAGVGMGAWLARRRHQ